MQPLVLPSLCLSRERASEALCGRRATGDGRRATGAERAEKGREGNAETSRASRQGSGNFRSVSGISKLELIPEKGN